MPLDFTGQTVVVTGGANGIGRALCLAFKRNGAHVLCTDYDRDAGAEAASEAEAIATGAFKFVDADMAQSDAPQQVVDEALRWRGGEPIAVLVNNVGVQSDNGTPCHLLQESVWDQVMNVNLKSYFLMAKHALPGMLQARAGCIINMASVQGHQSQVGIPAYASSKGGILSLTRQIAMDYSSSGIRCVSVSPGTILTPLVQGVITDDPVQFPDGIAGLDRDYPRGRVGDPADVANLCLYLASEYAANVTGADVCCDGGVMAMGGWNRNVGWRSYTQP